MGETWANRAGSVSVVVFAMVLPMAASPFLTDTTFATRLLISAIGIALACTVPSQTSLPRPVQWAVLACLAVFVAAAVAGETPVLSLVGRYPRYEGLIAVVGYAGALVAGARLLGPGQAGRRRLFCSASSLTAIAIAAIAALQAVTRPDERVTALLGNATVLGTWAAALTCLLGWQVLTERRVLWITGMVAGMLNVLLSASRGAMVALAVALVAAAVIRGWTRARPPVWLALATGTAFAAAAWLLPSVRGRLTGATPFADATISGRTLLWSNTAGLVESNPWLGVGPSRFVDAIGPFHTAQWAAAVGPYAPPDSPHNLLLQVLSSTGVTGLCALIALLVTIIVGLWRARPWDGWAAGGTLATLAAAVSYLFSFTDPLTTTMVLVCLGGALAEARHSRFPNLARAVCWAWATVALLLHGSVLVTEARFSTAISNPATTTAELLDARAARPWDPDLTRRVSYTIARLAERDLADPAPAVPIITDACETLVSSTECLHTLGDLQALAGQPEESVRTLTRALAIDPTNVDTLLKRGIAQAESGDPEAAERDFTAAVELRPTAPEAWENLAVLYRRQGRSADAAQAAQKAKELRR